MFQWTVNTYPHHLHDFPLSRLHIHCIRTIHDERIVPLWISTEKSAYPRNGRFIRGVVFHYGFLKIIDPEHNSKFYSLPYENPFQIHCYSPHVITLHFSWFVFDSIDCVMQVLENLFFSVGLEFVSEWVVFYSILYANEIKPKVSQQTCKVLIYWVCLVGSAFGNLEYVSDFSVLFL